jgi:hypothetical protein
MSALGDYFGNLRKPFLRISIHERPETHPVPG